MILSKIIKRLRINSFLLFLIPSIAIIGSLQIHNFLTDFQYRLDHKNINLTDEPGKKYNVKCTKNNGFCMGKVSEYLFEMAIKIDDCFINEVKSYYTVNGKIYNKTSDVFNLVNGKSIIKEEYIDSEIIFTKSVSNKKNEYCIKNSKTYYFFYKYFPPFSYIIDEKIKGIALGTHLKVNPFLYGEVSISNLVKRHPINIFFKFFLYLSVILMIAYWYNYNKIFKKVLNKNINIFYIFGICSAVFLFFHIYFLGSTSDNEVLKVFRRIVIVLFILFEVLAQTLLALKIFKNRNIFLKYCFKFMVLIKLFFVLSILIFTIAIVIILSIYNLSSNVDYILEWNYFIVLLVFYLFSSLMWKKIINF
jgi:hypothetical protein